MFTASGKGTRELAVFHGYRQLVLWRAPGRAMLSYHACPFLYLILVLHGRRGGDRVQVGGRRRCHPLQRSAARERTEGGAEGTTDVCRSEGSKYTLATPRYRFQTNAGVSELRRVSTHPGPGVHEYRHRHRGRHHPTDCPTGRFSGCNTRWSARAGCAGKWRSVHHLACRSGHSLDPGVSSGSNRRQCMHLGGGDFPRTAALVAVADTTRETALTSCPASRRWRFSGFPPLRFGHAAVPGSAHARACRPPGALGWRSPGDC